MFDTPSLRPLRLLALLIALPCLTISSTVLAHSSPGVGLGMAVGATWSPSKIKIRQDANSLVGNSNAGETIRLGNASSLAVFVDIPLGGTFHLMPATVLRTNDLGHGDTPITDLDLNFKFIVPFGFWYLGIGAITGVTASDEFSGHWGLFSEVSYNVIANLDVFAMAQYKKLWRGLESIDDLHAYLGLMFRL